MLKRLIRLWPFHDLEIGRIHDSWYYYIAGDFCGKPIYFDSVTQDDMFAYMRSPVFVSTCQFVKEEPIWRT